MFKTKKNKFPIKLFVIAATIAYIAFIFVYFSISYKVRSGFNGENRPRNLSLYLQENKIKDPFITRVPGLEDVLAGPIISDSDPSKGPKDALVRLVVFSDFKCGYYAQNRKIIEDLILKYKDQVRFIWKDYPDKDKNSITYLAARAGRCAQEQGKFWTFNDLVYDYSSVLQKSMLREIASKAELDLGPYDVCMDKHEVDVLIDSNIKEAEALEITGIPFIFVNTQEMMGSIDRETLERMVNIELFR